MSRAATGSIVEKPTKDGITFVLRFRAYGRREYLTLGKEAEGWTRGKAEEELTNVLADVRRKIWRPQSTPGEESQQDPTFHEFASEWFEGHRHALRASTVADYEWQLTHHLLPFFKSYRLSEIDTRSVDRYRQQKAKDGKLSATSINKTITRLAQILEAAVEYGLIDRNHAKGKRRRLPASKRPLSHLDRASHISALLEAGRQLDARARVDRRHVARQAVISVMVFAGLRIGEVTALRWGDVDLANGRLRVEESKTDAGVRYVDLLSPLRDTLAELRAKVRPRNDQLVFPTSTGTPMGKDNVRNRILAPAVKRANETLEKEGAGMLPSRLTPHGLRRTFASILAAKGEDPRYVMGQLGHTDPAFTIKLYTREMTRDAEERRRLVDLVGGESPRVPAESQTATGDPRTQGPGVASSTAGRSSGLERRDARS